MDVMVKCSYQMQTKFSCNGYGLCLFGLTYELFADVLELMVRYTVWQLLGDFDVEENLCRIQDIVCNVSIATVIGMTIRFWLVTVNKEAD